jgi:WD40 repeat protein
MMLRSSVLLVLLVLAVVARAQEKPSPPDNLDDPLPAGAIARLGTARFRLPGSSWSSALSPDGQTLASGGGGQITLLDVRSGRRLRTWEVQKVRLLTFLDDKTLVSVDRRNVRYWSTESGKEAGTPLPVYAEVASLLDAEPSLAGGSLAVHEKGHVAVWDLRQRKRLHSFAATTEGPIAMNPDGTRVALLGPDETLEVWDATAGKKTASAPDLPGHPLKLQFSPDGKMLAGRGRQLGYRIWDPETLEKLAVFKQASPESAMAFSSDSKRFATIHAGGHLRIWELTTKKRICESQLVAGAFSLYVRSIQFTPDNERVVTAGDSVVRVWNAKTGAQITDARAPQMSASRVVGSGDGRSAAGIYGSTLCVWDLETRKERFRRLEAEWQTSPAFSRDSRRIAFTGFDGAIHVCDAKTGQEIVVTKLPSERTARIAFAPDDKTILSVGWDSVLREWAVDTGKEIRTIELDKPKFDGFDTGFSDSLSSDGSVVTRLFWTRPKEAVADPASQKLRHRVWRFDMKSGQRLPGEVEVPEPSGLLLSPDKRTLAVVGHGDSLHLFDAIDGKSLALLRPSTTGYWANTLSHYQSLAFSPDGRLLAVNRSYGDPGIEIWDVTSRKRIQEFPNPVSVDGLAFLGNDLLASSDPDTSIRVWRVKTPTD